jgi:hypothetical protein
MNRLRLTNPEITNAIGHPINVNRHFSYHRYYLYAGIEKETREHQKNLKKILKPFLAPIQIILDEVNGRAYANVIPQAQWLADIAIEVEIELRTKGVTIKNMNGTTIYYSNSAGFNGVSTGAHLNRGATGWFVTNIEKTYEQRGKRLVSITPEARANIIKAQLGQYGEVQDNI